MFEQKYPAGGEAVVWGRHLNSDFFAATILRLNWRTISRNVHTFMNEVNQGFKNLFTGAKEVTRVRENFDNFHKKKNGWPELKLETDGINRPCRISRSEFKIKKKYFFWLKFNVYPNLNRSRALCK